jgi:hypothetical protein
MLSHHSQTARRMAVKLGGRVDPRGMMVLSGILQLPGSRVTPRVIKGPRVAPLHPREKFVSQVL